MIDPKIDYNVYELDLNLKRYANCIALSEQHKPGTWPYEFWLLTAVKLQRDVNQLKTFSITNYFESKSDV